MQLNLTIHLFSNGTGDVLDAVKTMKREFKQYCSSVILKNDCLHATAEYLVYCVNDVQEIIGHITHMTSLYPNLQVVAEYHDNGKKNKLGLPFAKRIYAQEDEYGCDVVWDWDTMVLPNEAKLEDYVDTQSVIAQHSSAVQYETDGMACITADSDAVQEIANWDMLEDCYMEGSGNKLNFAWGAPYADIDFAELVTKLSEFAKARKKEMVLDYTTDMPYGAFRLFFDENGKMAFYQAAWPDAPEGFNI